MKVLFKYSKSLGNNSKDDENEMFASTASILQRKGFGSITKKITSVKKGVNGIEKKYAVLTDEDKTKLKLDEKIGLSKEEPKKEDK